MFVNPVTLRVKINHHRVGEIVLLVKHRRQAGYRLEFDTESIVSLVKHRRQAGYIDLSLILSLQHWGGDGQIPGAQWPSEAAVWQASGSVKDPVFKNKVDDL